MKAYRTRVVTTNEIVYDRVYSKPAAILCKLTLRSDGVIQGNKKGIIGPVMPKFRQHRFMQEVVFAVYVEVGKNCSVYVLW